MTTTPKQPDAEIQQVAISQLGLGECRPSPENDTLYRPIDPGDPDLLALAESIVHQGLLEPIVVTLDGWIVSGHRRREAARLAGLESIPCRVLDVRRTDDVDAFVKLLREFNRQREKSHDERLRECLIDVNPEEAYRNLKEHRRQAARVDTAAMELAPAKARPKISKAKRPMLAAAMKVIADLRDFWPLSLRKIHYGLLNNPPLKHASKPDSTYQNDLLSYQNLSGLLIRARLDGHVPMDAIDDETRPVTVWLVDAECTGFIRRELDGLLKGYSRDLLQSQPNHIEIVGEKKTLSTILKPVASEFCIPLTLGGGYCSYPPRQAIAERFRKSGKTKLVLLLLTDFDPDGMNIAESFAQSMKRDFKIESVHAARVALTSGQVIEHRLPARMKAKTGSSQCEKFVEKYGDDVHELEALSPEALQKILRDAIESTIDVNAFNREIDAERADSIHLDSLRRLIHQNMKGVA